MEISSRGGGVLRRCHGGCAASEHGQELACLAFRSRRPQYTLHAKKIRIQIKIKVSDKRRQCEIFLAYGEHDNEGRCTSYL
jgi:hypothetical protein